MAARADGAPRQETPRQETPRQETPRQETPCQETSRPETGRRRFCAAALLGASVSLLAGCGEEEAPAGPAAAGHASAAAPRRDWLERTDETAPEAWLAARAAPPGKAPEPQMEDELRRLLAAGAQVFREPARMLANRTDQLRRMLAEIRVDEPPQLILAGFVELGRAGRKAGYGDLCQHYFNLRAQGLDRSAALAALARGTPGGPPAKGEGAAKANRTGAAP